MFHRSQVFRYQFIKLGLLSLTLLMFVALLGCASAAARQLNGKVDSVNSQRTSTGSKGSYPEDYEIEPKALAELMSKGVPLRIIDVRDPQEVQDQPFLGAENIPLEQVPQRLKDLDPNEEIIIICRSGRRSALAAKYLIQEGFTNVKHLKGGMNAWLKEDDIILTAAP